jgi:formylglycine-generating enzyme required for sulfatase activity/TRAP-type uncharacterized transport system substrate-binding protein
MERNQIDLIIGVVGVALIVVAAAGAWEWYGAAPPPGAAPPSIVASAVPPPSRAGAAPSSTPSRSTGPLSPAAPASVLPLAPPVETTGARAPSAAPAEVASASPPAPPPEAASAPPPAAPAPETASAPAPLPEVASASPHETPGTPTPTPTPTPLAPPPGAAGMPTPAQTASAPAAVASVTAPPAPEAAAAGAPAAAGGTITGRAAPGAVVTVFDGGREIGRVTADRNGDWVLTPRSEGGKGALVERANHGLVELVTGGGDAASIQMAEDLAGVTNDRTTRRLLFTIGTGAVQDLLDLELLRGVDLAIVQSDTLDYARQRKMVPGIENSTYIARLHSEELHLLARADIRSIEDLAGRKVAFAGGAAITGPAVLEMLRLKVEPVIDDPAVALAKLKSGSVAAFAYVAAKPAPLFHGLGAGDGVHFLPIPLKIAVASAYVPARLTAADYPRLIASDAPVPTVAVGMVMVAANLTPANERYHNIEDFVDAFFTRFPQLQQPPHHPKWTEVDLAAELPGWKRFPAAEQWLKHRVGAQARLAQPSAPAERAVGGESIPPMPVAAAAPPVAKPVPPATSKEPELVTLPGGTLLEMVRLPGGPFLMGSDDDPSERPIHRVTIAPFAIARYPVTVRQWKECVAARGCPDIAAGGDNAPMTDVSWDDAQRFVAWLAKLTGKAYRLPSEAEWEYAARAGTRTRYWWGNQMMRGMADCKGCGDSYDPRHPVKVASFPPNPFGLRDMTGTVAEWVEDCWHRNYYGAPADNSPWNGGDCRQHVLRGGSWQNDPSYLRASSRDAYDTSVRYLTHGLRPAERDQDASFQYLMPSKGAFR